MFAINPAKETKSALPLITGNYSELLAIDMPTLYSGTNDFGNRVLGVIVEESDDYLARYFHVIVSSATYYSFLKKRISLRKIIEDAEMLFVVDKLFDEVRQTYVIRSNEIPEEYLPYEDSFCPDIVFAPSFDYGISLKGKTADLHLVEIQDANFMQLSFERILKHTMDGLKDALGINLRSYLKPATTSSYRVNYKIEFSTPQVTMFKPNEQLLAEYVSAYLSYILQELPLEEDNALNKHEITSQNFIELQDKFAKVLLSANHEESVYKVKQQLVNSIRESANEFETVTNRLKLSPSFSKLEVINYPETGGEIEIGFVDEKFFATINPKLPPKNLEEEKTIKDTQYTKYRVRVYLFNTETGNCWAYYYPDKTEFHYKVPIKIKANGKPYYDSIFSKSLHSEEIVTIEAKAERDKDDIVKVFNTEL